MSHVIGYNLQLSEFAGTLGYGNYRNFKGIVEKAKLACFNSGHHIEDHFVDVTEMIEIGKGGRRPVKTARRPSLHRLAPVLSPRLRRGGRSCSCATAK